MNDPNQSTTLTDFVRFVLAYNDDDPWRVSPHEWERRLAEEGYRAWQWPMLTDPDLRATVRSMDDEYTQALRDIENAIVTRRPKVPIAPDEPRRQELHPCDDALSVSLGSAIRRERQKQRRLLAPVARASGMSRASLSRIETGLRSPTISEVNRIARALGTRLEILLEAARADAR